MSANTPLSAATLVALLTLATPASADPVEQSPDFHADAEVDPLAYVLNGYSVHVGAGWRRLRFDLGAYAMAMPQALHGNEGFDASFSGFGLKAEYFLLADQGGPVVGAGLGLMRVHVEREGTGLSSTHAQYSLGVHAGWRVLLPANLYVTPWLGLDYSFNARDVHLEGQTYASSPWSVFPAIHLGYRFR